MVIFLVIQCTNQKASINNENTDANDPAGEVNMSLIMFIIRPVFLLEYLPFVYLSNHIAKIHKNFY